MWKLAYETPRARADNIDKFISYVEYLLKLYLNDMTKIISN